MDFHKILISYKDSGFNEKIAALRQKTCAAAVFNPLSSESETVFKIIDDVSRTGDTKVADYTEQFDSVRLSPAQFKITEKELKQAHDQIDSDLLISIRRAIENVKLYQQQIFTASDKVTSGNTGVKYNPISRVGVCIPGASAPLPSTVIMTVVPALVAGVKEIVAVSPPRFNVSIHPVILAVCHELSVSEVYRIGGVQAVAAMAYGTETIKPVDMIVGPGNKWVQTAKRAVFGKVGIDSLAGPSEVLIIADENSNPQWVAADMLSQAEHAPGSAILLTDSAKIVNDVMDSLAEQVTRLNRSSETADSLKKYSAIVEVKNLDQAIELANRFATEHLQIQCGDKSAAICDRIKNAGAIFVGSYSPVATGDYFAGPSHTLPTGGGARFSSPLSCNDFVKSTSIIHYDRAKLSAGSEDIIRLAKAEGLDAHAKSVEIRKSK